MEPTGVYEGQFLSGDKEGRGVYRSENGTRYEGTYNNGYREGSGTIYNGDDSIAYKGEMSMGLPHGAGSVYKGGNELKTTWVEGIDSNLLPERRQ